MRLDNKTFDPTEQAFLDEVGLNPDDLERLAEGAPPVDAAVRERIRSRVHQKALAAPAPAPLRPRRLHWAVAATLLIALGTTALVASSAAAQEALMRLVRIIPGVGIATTDEGSQILKEPVTVDLGGPKAVVTGLVSTPDETRVRVTVTGLVRPPAGRVQVQGAEGALLLPDGRRLDLRRSKHSRSLESMELTLFFPPLPAGTARVQLEVDGPVFDLKQGLQADLALVGAGDRELPAAWEGGRSQEAHGVTVVVPHFGLDGDRIRLTAEVEGAELALDLLERRTPELQPHLTDERGRTYPLIQTESDAFGMRRDGKYELVFKGPVPADAGALRLVVPSLTVYREGSATLPLPLAQLQPGQTLTIDRELQVGDFTVRVDSVTRWDPTRFDINYRPDEIRTLSVGVKGTRLSFSNHELGASAQTVTLELPFPPEGPELVLEFHRPQVRLQGPWTVDLTLAR